MKKLVFLIVFILGATIVKSQVGYIQGSSIGNFFQAMYRTSNYEGMVELTSSKSVKQHGKENILSFYKNMQFGYELGKPTACVNNADGSTTLVYGNAKVFATKTKKEITFVKEKGKYGDYKILLPNNLKDFLK